MSLASKTTAAFCLYADAPRPLIIAAALPPRRRRVVHLFRFLPYFQIETMEHHSGGGLSRTRSSVAWPTGGGIIGRARQRSGIIAVIPAMTAGEQLANSRIRGDETSLDR